MALDAKYRKVKKFVIICRILCLIGCVYQLVMICLVFFKFPVVLEMDVHRHSTFEPPRITLCVNKYILATTPEFNRLVYEFVALISELLQKHGKTLPTDVLIPSNNDSDHKVAYTMEKVDNIDMQLTNTFGHKVLISDVCLKTTRSHQCNASFSVTPFVTLRDKCFDLSFDVDSPLLEITLKLNKTYVDYDLKLALRSSREPITYTELDWITFRPGKFTSIGISYHKTDIKQSQFLFKSDCTSEINCVDNCLIKTYDEECVQNKNGILSPVKGQYWPPNVPGFEGNERNILFQKIHPVFCGDDTVCSEKCDQKPCFKETYEIRHLSESFLNWDKESPTFNVTVGPPSSHVNYEYKPKQTLVEFLCYLMSVTSFWFGLSMVSFFTKLIDTSSKRKLIKNHIEKGLRSIAFNRPEMNA